MESPNLFKRQRVNDLHQQKIYDPYNLTLVFSPPKNCLAFV